MKKLIIVFFIAFCVVGIQQVAAQYKSESNRVRTRVGNPVVGSPIDAPPIPGGNARQAVLNEFGVTIDASHPTSYAEWAWEFLWEVSDTSFDERVKGTIVGRDDGGSWQENCKKINIRGTYDRALFRIVFTHEMGHIIMNCPVGETFRDAHNTARRDEGQLTIYSRVLCTYGGKGGPWESESENYAEMIAYYLNPDVNSRTACGEEPNPYANGGHPKHRTVAENILGPYQQL